MPQLKPYAANHQIYVPVGQIVRNARRKAGLTQIQLADRVSCTPQQVGNIETGKHTPTVQLLIRIADGLQVEPWRILRAACTLAGRLEDQGSQQQGPRARKEAV